MKTFMYNGKDRIYLRFGISNKMWLLIWDGHEKKLSLNLTQGVFIWNCHIYLMSGILFYRNIDDVDKTMDEINEQTENMKQIQEALSTPIGAAADFDEVSKIYF